MHILCGGKISKDIFKIHGGEIFLKGPNKGKSGGCKEAKTMHKGRTKGAQVFIRFGF